jgi:small subunit ribosomal protein S2
MSDISMQEMLEAGIHFGHKTRYWNPAMAPYIYGIRSQIHIINLDETLHRFQTALNVIANLAANRGKILFVGTKGAARDIIQQEASRAGMPYVNYRWLGGMLTNYKTIRQSIKRFKDLEARFSNEAKLVGMTKKEALNLMREKEKLAANVSGIANMGGLPDALFVIDVNYEKIAVSEANRLGIPVIAIVDTNCSPNGVDYVVPGNDDALRAIRFYCKAVTDKIIAARGVVTEENQPEASDEAVEPKKIVTKKVKLTKRAESESVAPEPVKTEAKAKPKNSAEKPAEKKKTATTSSRAKVTKEAAIEKEV